MRKFVAFFIAIAMLMSVPMLTGCGSEQSGQDEALIGRWAWDTHSNFVYTFNADGTGTRPGIEGVEEIFSWNTSGGELRIDRDADDGHIQNERWAFTIEGDTLTLDGHNRIFVYNRIP